MLIEDHITTFCKTLFPTERKLSGGMKEFLNQKARDISHKLQGDSPSLEDLEDIHIEDLVEYMADIREEVGYYRRLRKKPGLHPEIVDLLEDLIKLKRQELHIVKKQIEDLRNGKEIEPAGTGELQRAGQGSGGGPQKLDNVLSSGSLPKERR